MTVILRDLSPKQVEALIACGGKQLDRTAVEVDTQQSVLDWLNSQVSRTRAGHPHRRALLWVVRREKARQP